MTVWWGILASATTWTTLYYGIKYRWKLESEWSCRLLTAIHAILVTTLAALACLTGPWPFTDPGGPNTNMQCITIVLSLGYFIFDLMWCLYHQTEGMTMLIHHIVSIISLSRILIKGVSGTEAVAGIGGLEITNPLLQLRWFLRSSGYKHTVYFIVVEISFMILFFIMRIIMGSYLFYTTVVHPRPDLEAKIFATAFYAISWVFMIYIVQYFVAKYIRPGHKHKIEDGKSRQKGGEISRQTGEEISRQTGEEISRQKGDDISMLKDKAV